MSALTDLFTGIANAIRGKTGETGVIAASEFATAIAGLPAGAVSGEKKGLGNSTYFADCVGKENIMVTIAYAGPGLSGVLSCASVVGGVSYRQICGESTSSGAASWDKDTGILVINNSSSGSRTYRYAAW